MSNGVNLVIKTIGTNCPEIFVALPSLSKSTGCNITNSYMEICGSEYCVSLMVNGTWDQIAKFEAGMCTLQKKYNLLCIQDRTDVKPHKTDVLHYIISVVSLDQPGLLAVITKFFQQMKVDIEQINTQTFQTLAKVVMTSINIKLTIPAKANIAHIREQFLLLCESHNLDATLEPNLSSFEAT